MGFPMGGDGKVTPIGGLQLTVETIIEMDKIAADALEEIAEMLAGGEATSHGIALVIRDAFKKRSQIVGDI